MNNPSLHRLTSCLPIWIRVLPLAVLLAVLPSRVFAVAGERDTGFDPAVESKDGYVAVTAVQTDGNIIVAGSFTKIGSAKRNNIARIFPDGGVDPSFKPGAGTDGEILAAVLQPDGRIVIGGNFTNYNGVPCGRIARLNSDGSLDLGFKATGADNLVLCLARQADGRILVGGAFFTFNGQSQTRLTRIFDNGELDPGFDAGTGPGLGPNQFVATIAAQPDGQIVIGGSFTSFNGSPRNYLARLNHDGSVEGPGTFNIGSGAEFHVYCLAIQPDGKILIGGRFLTFNGVGPSQITRLNANGTKDNGFLLIAGGLRANDFVNSIALQADGKILIGGFFDSLNSLTGEYHGSIARLMPDGSTEQSNSFNPGAGTSDAVLSVALQEGRILAGGDFRTFNGLEKRVNPVALLNDPATHDIVPQFNTVKWQRSGAAPEVENLTFELSQDGGATFELLGVPTRVVQDWQLTGIEIPAVGILRARGFAVGGYDNGVAAPIEQTLNYSLPNTQLHSALRASNQTQLSNRVVNFELFAEAPGSPALTYTIDFDDGTPLSSVSIANGATISIPHIYTVTGDFDVITVVSDGLGATSTHKVEEHIVEPNAGGIGVPNVATSDPVTNPLNGLELGVTESNGGFVKLGVNIAAFSLFAGGTPLKAAAPRATLADVFVNTEFGDIPGHSANEPGLEPVHLFTHRGIFIATTTLRDKVTGEVVGIARRTLTISEKETENVNALESDSSGIETKKVKGKVVFDSSKSDVLTFSGTIKLPQGLDTSKEHEFSFALGNIVANTTLNTKGVGTPTDGGRFVKKVKVKYVKVPKGAVTAGGEDAKVDVTLMGAGMVAAGFDTEGITKDGVGVVPGEGSVERTLQVSMLLDGVPYEGRVPITLEVSKKSDTGKIAGQPQS